MKQRVLVFSVDAMVYEDLQHLRNCQNTKKYFQNASGVRHIKSIYPTVTYPAHTTILTGCYPAKHGVISNTHFTTGSTEYEWLWDASNIKVPDVITAAKDHGYTTGAVFWPVTGNHKAVDYLIDEYWCPHEGETLLGGFSDMGSSPEMLKIIEKNQGLLPNDGKLGRVALMDHPQIDHFLISCACDIIREYSPEFMLVHNGNIDDARHKYGVFNEEVTHGLDLVDLWIGQLMQALQDSGHLNDTDVIIVSDHGQMDLSRVIKPNVFLADAGLIQVDENGNLKDWTAFCCSNAMSAMVYLKDPANADDYAKTYKVLKKMAEEGIYGFTTVYTKEETKAMGLDGEFSFVLETDGYTSFSTDWNRPAVRPFDRNDFRYGHATHGYLPEKGPQPTFMAIGPSFKENVWLDNADMVDEAPTFAKLLGVPLPTAQGKVLNELLR